MPHYHKELLLSCKDRKVTMSHVTMPSTSFSSCYPPSPVYFHVLPSSRITITFTQMSVVKTLVSEKHFGLFDRGQRGMTENITLDGKAETSNAVAPTIRPTSPGSVTVIHYFPLYLLHTAKRQSHYSLQIQFFSSCKTSEFLSEGDRLHMVRISP
jgi:hypothetical protein